MGQTKPMVKKKEFNDGSMERRNEPLFQIPSRSIYPPQTVLNDLVDVTVIVELELNIVVILLIIVQYVQHCNDRTISTQEKQMLNEEKKKRMNDR